MRHFDIEAMAVSKRYIVNLNNGAFDIAGDVIDSLQDKVTDFFNEITQEVKALSFPPNSAVTASSTWPLAEAIRGSGRPVRA